MLATFVRHAGERDRIYVRRSNGEEISWQFPTYGNEVPHDLVHLVVEAAFGLREGFWGRVDAGVDPARVNAEADRVGGRDKYHGYGTDRSELLAAEALAAARWATPETSDDERLALIAEGCAQYAVAMPPAVTLARIAEARAVLDALRACWAGLLPSGALRLPFEPAAPTRAFERIAAIAAIAAGREDPPR